MIALSGPRLVDPLLDLLLRHVELFIRGCVWQVQSRVRGKRGSARVHAR